MEIGPGTWDFAKLILEKNGCTWQGLEPVDFSENNLTHIKGSVEKIPVHNNTFDVVLCNQSIEHWFEYGVSFKKALSEINRVLKSGGTLMVNAPIHLHGHPYFLRGDYVRIKKLFSKKDWALNLFELGFISKQIRGWTKIGTKGFLKNYGYPSCLIKNPTTARSHIINIHVTKRKTLSFKDAHESYSIRVIKVIIRFIKELIFYYF